jgi:hypothetical protein
MMFFGGVYGVMSYKGLLAAGCTFGTGMLQEYFGFDGTGAIQCRIIIQNDPSSCQ